MSLSSIPLDKKFRNIPQLRMLRMHRFLKVVLFFVLFFFFLILMGCETSTEPVFQTGDIRMLLLGTRRDGKGPLYVKKLKEARSHSIVSGLAYSVFEISLSPDGRKIALEISLKNYFLVLNSDGTELRKIQVPGSYFSQLQFSPENSFVVGVLSLNDNTFLSVYDLRFNWMKQITEPDEKAYTFRILPDGKSLIYVANGKTLMQRNLDGSGKRMITQLPFSAYKLVFRRNGKRLYLHDGKNVYGMDFPKGNPVQLTHFTEGKLFDFDVSPDDKQIACLVGITPDDGIFVVQRESGQVREIFRGKDVQQPLRFTPDGQYIAFIMNQVVEQNSLLQLIFAIRPDGSHFHQISDLPYQGTDGKVKYPEFRRYAFFPLH